MKENLTVAELKNKCVDLKKNVISMIWKAQSGHPGGSLSVADFMTACYWHAMDVDPKNPRWEDRDRFVLSKGHVCPAQYAALAMKGFFPMEVLDTLRKEGSPLQGHPSMTKCPGIDISTGSLGQGLACAVGMAIAAKMDGKSYNVFCALGDGETNEGEIWEACGTAHKYGLDNLIVFVDWNNLQLDGTCEEIMPLGSLAKKFSAFGFETYEINGNDMSMRSIRPWPRRTGCPSASSARPSRATASATWKTRSAGTASLRTTNSTNRPWTSWTPSTSELWRAEK